MIRNKISVMAVLSITFSVCIYLLFIGTTTVESRFGYPVYLLSLILIGYGSSKLYDLLIVNKYNIKKVAVIVLGYLFTVIFFFGLSILLDNQTNRIFWF